MMTNYDSPSGRHSEIQNTAITRIVHPHLMAMMTMVMMMMMMMTMMTMMMTMAIAIMVMMVMVKVIACGRYSEIQNTPIIRRVVPHLSIGWIGNDQ